VSYDLNSSLVSGVNNLTYTSSLVGNLGGNSLANRIDASSATGAVSINGGAGADTLLGGVGNDTLVGNGSSSLVGGAGNDLYILNSLGDRISDAGGSNTIQSDAFTNLASTLAIGVNNLTYTGASATLLGNANANRIDASAATGAVALNGGAGADTLIGSSLGDTLLGNGSSSLVGGGGANTYVVTSTTDRINDAGGSASTVLSSVSYDLASSLAGGVTGSLANLTYTSTLGGSLRGNSSANLITGNNGSDTLLGADGADTLKAFGKSGGGIQSANFERDVLTGGAGADTFVLGDTNGSFYLDSGMYLVSTSPSDASWCGITDFEVGVDKIILSQSVYDETGYGVEFYGDIKQYILPQELKAISSSIGITPRDSDVILFQGMFDPINGGFDFMAAIRTTVDVRPTESEILNSVKFV
jgi:Ca2+-binding RTX toxin-like protein